MAIFYKIFICLHMFYFSHHYVAIISKIKMDAVHIHTRSYTFTRYRKAFTRIETRSPNNGMGSCTNWYVLEEGRKMFFV